MRTHCSQLRRITRPRTIETSFTRLIDGQSVDDTMQFCDFQISEESQKELLQPNDGYDNNNNNNNQQQQHDQQKDNQQQQPKHQQYQDNDPNPPPLPSPKNSLLFGEHDLEAISALNSLSNSPFGRGTKQPGSGTTATTNKEKEFTPSSDEKDNDEKGHKMEPVQQQQEQEQQEVKDEQQQQQPNDDEETMKKKAVMKKEPPKSLFAAVIGGIKDKKMNQKK